MALSKDEVQILTFDEIQILKEMIADDSISKQEKDMYREMLGETPATASQPAKKKATKKKSTPKKKKVSESDIDKMKAQIKQRTGKTEEECEKIVDEYRALRKKATTRKKKETATKEKSKQRTTKLKKEGKVIEGTTEKNVEATIDTATKTATKKVDKEITKIEKTTKGEKQVEKKIDQLVKKALASSKKFVSDMAKELSTKSKTDGKTYLLGLRSQIDALLKKYELGGEVFDGSGDSINFGSGGFTSSYNIQDGMISVGNNVKFEEGGDVFDGSGDSVNFAKGGKVYAIDIDLENGEQPRESKFQYTHNEFGLHQAKEHFNRLKKEGVYEYNDIKEPIENIQLLEVDNDNDDYRVIDSEFFAKGGVISTQSKDVKSIERTNKGIPPFTGVITLNSGEKLNFTDKTDPFGLKKFNRYPDGSREMINNNGEKTLLSKKEIDEMLKDYKEKGGKIDFSDKNNYRNTSGKPNWDKISEKDLKKNYKKMDNDFRDRISYKEFKEIFIEQDVEVYAKGGMSQGYNDRLDESLGSRRGTSMSHHQNYKDRRDESKGMETGMGRRAYRGVDTMDNN
jgi:hypothetical protein